MIPQLYYYNGMSVSQEGMLSSMHVASNNFYFVGNTLPIYYQPTLMIVAPEDFKKSIESNIHERPVRSKIRASQNVITTKEANEHNPVKRIQNPLRNIFTNLTNLILNFILSRKKMNNLLSNIDPSFINEKLLCF
jgi:hypothetical protein